MIFFKQTSFGIFIVNSLKENRNQFAILENEDFLIFFILSTNQTLNSYISKFVEFRISNNNKLREILVKKERKDVNWDLEHIMPLSNLDETWDLETYNEGYLWKIGNIFLLERSINAKVKNKNFQEKKKFYKNSKMLGIKKTTQKSSWNVKQINDSTRDILIYIYLISRLSFQEWLIN